MACSSSISPKSSCTLISLLTLILTRDTLPLFVSTLRELLEPFSKDRVAKVSLGIYVASGADFTQCDGATV